MADSNPIHLNAMWIFFVVWDWFGLRVFFPPTFMGSRPLPNIKNMNIYLIKLGEPTHLNRICYQPNNLYWVSYKCCLLHFCNKYANQSQTGKGGLDQPKSELAKKETTRPTLNRHGVGADQPFDSTYCHFSMIWAFLSLASHVFILNIYHQFSKKKFLVLLCWVVHDSFKSDTSTQDQGLSPGHVCNAQCEHHSTTRECVGH